MADTKDDNVNQGDGENIELKDKPEGEKASTEVKKLTRDLLQSPEAMAAFEQKLASMIGRNSGYVDSLPKCVKRRLKALKRLQSEYHVTEAKFYEELHELECKYAELYKPYLEKRREIVMAVKEPTDSECEWMNEEEDEEEEEKQRAKITEIDETKKDEEKTEKDEEKTGNDSSKSPFDENTKGVPEFWLTIFKNVDILSSMIEEHDEPIFKSLEDVRVKLLSDGKMGFVLEFVFGGNEYFENTVLTKEYIMRCAPDAKAPLEYEGPQIVKCTGCKIDWKKGKNVTVKNVKAKQKGKTGPKKMVTKTVKCNSFFNFFSPPESPEDEEEEEDEEIQAVLMQDYEVGQLLQQTIIPKAILYFTGEALENDDEDYDYGGEEEDGEDCDEDEDPDYKPKPGAEKPGDCKQQ